MSSIAYLNNKLVYAALCHNRNVDYICPGCGVPMHLCSVNGKRSAYFSGKHVATCPYRSNYFNPDIYDENKFDINQIFDQLLQPDVPTIRHISQSHSTRFSGSKIPVSTVQTLYRICTYYGVAKTYGGIKISEIFVPLSSDCSKINGYKLVECHWHSYNTKLKTITFNYSSGKCIAEIENVDLFKALRNFTYSDKSQGKPVFVIAGKWVDSRCSVVNPAQIFLP